MNNLATAGDDVVGGGVYLYNTAQDFTGNLVAGNQATATNLSTGGLFYKPTSSLAGFAHNTIALNTATGSTQAGGLWVDSSSSATPSLADNNVYGNTSFNLYNDYSADFDATSVYWGSTAWAVIEAAIYDKDDDSSKGIVFFDPYLDAPHPSAPVIPGQAGHLDAAPQEVLLPNGGTEERHFAFVNVGTEVLTYTTRLEPAGLEWLELAAGSGQVEVGGLAPITAMFDATMLLSGTYSATLIVESPGLWHGPARVPVALTVVDHPTPEHQLYLPLVTK